MYVMFPPQVDGWPAQHTVHFSSPSARLSVLSCVLSEQVSRRFIHLFVLIYFLVMLNLLQMLEKQQEIDDHMASLLQSLLEAVSTASQCGSDSMKHEVIHLASQCAEILDGWISHNLGGKLYPLYPRIGLSFTDYRVTQHNSFTE